MNAGKKKRSVRMNESTHAIIGRLSKRYGMTTDDVIATALAQLAVDVRENKAEVIESIEKMKRRSSV
jgi:antitoxin component of RelBE/YafQ-DinJ toxin-antitoxin module